MENNTIFEKIWEDVYMAEYEITCTAKLIFIKQFVYIQSDDMKMIADRISDFIKYPRKSQYIQIGEKTGRYNSAFSMEFISADNRGHVLVEFDLEIDDNEERKHRASFYVKSELGLVERFGKRLLALASKEIGNKVELMDSFI